MSLILEALRKSEAERRRDSAPDVAMELPPAPMRTARATPAWLWPLLAMVMVGSIALFMLGGGLGKHMAARDNIAEAATAPPALHGQPQVQPAPVVMPRILPPAEPAAPPSVSIVSAAPAPHLQPQPQTPSPVAASIDSDAPDLAATSLSPIKLSMHMWDADPARRFVILDGQRMGEGDRTGTLEVISIDHNGVLIQRNGQRARIPLQ